MFRYVHPSFQIKHLLQVEMLEQLRDYPKNYLKLIFSGYGNGIVRGCGISWNNNKLTIEPGIIYYNHNLYMMNERYLLECWPENEKRYLKIEFMEEIQEPNQTVGMGRIKLSRDKADPSCELELCRFILQEEQGSETGMKILKITPQNMIPSISFTSRMPQRGSPAFSQAF